jgi:hypothetical protein
MVLQAMISQALVLQPSGLPIVRLRTDRLQNS